MGSMKPQQLARLLNVAPNTVRQWAREDFSEFLTPTAQGGNGMHRSFGDRDARIIAWIALLKAQNMPLADIVATLRSAQAADWHNLPPLPGGMANDEPIAVIPREAAQERLTAIEARYELQLQALTKERDELKDRLNRAEAKNADWERKYSAITERLMSLVEKQERRRK